MMLRLMLLGIFIISTTTVSAGERYMMSFTLTQGEKKIEEGKSFVSQKRHTWSKGLKRSYLQLNCNPRATVDGRKLFSTVNHFNGLSITHHLEANNLKLTVVRNVVEPRLSDIRALPKDECRNISPQVNTITQTYTFPVKNATPEPRPFGENMTLKVNLQPIGSTL